MSEDKHDEETLKHWLDALNQLQEEINNLKVGFSHVLSKEFSAALLVRMELFQTHLLNHDAAIAVLKHELSVQISNKKSGDVEPVQSDPVNDIKKMENEIERLKNQLAKYTNAFAQSAF